MTKVMCVDNSGYERKLTVGKVYEVEDSTNPKYYDGVGDNGNSFVAFRHRFKAVAVPEVPYIVAVREKHGYSPNTKPAYHATKESADTEALRLATAHGKDFGVFKLVSRAKPPVRPEATLEDVA